MISTSKLLLFILISCLFSCHHVSREDCLKFRNGSFYMHPKNTSFTFLIDRRDSIQTETLKETGETSDWELTWITDCKYKMKLIRSTFENAKYFKDTPNYTFEIIRSSENYYVFKQEISLLEEGSIDTIWKTK